MPKIRRTTTQTVEIPEDSVVDLDQLLGHGFELLENGDDNEGYAYYDLDEDAEDE